jgi:RHS repeat-associated protein
VTPITAATWDVIEKANDKQVTISKQNAGNALAQLSVGPYTLTLRVPGANRAAKSATASGISFAGSTANDSFAVVPTADGLEFSATLANANAPTTYQVALNTHGLVATLDADGRTIDLTDPKAADPTAIVGTISAPSLQEATGGAVDPSEITVSLNPKAASLQPGETLLTYAIDPTWLQNPARSFPVVLDPDVCMAYSYSVCPSTGMTDTFVLDGIAGKHQVGWTVDRVGSSVKGDGYGHMLTLLWWNLPQLGDGEVITSATVQVAQYWNGGSAGEKIHANLNASGFDMSTDWAHKPSIYSTQTPSISACGARNCWLDFDATALARTWYGHNGTAKNFGVTLSLDNQALGELQLDNYTDATDYRHPQLKITYFPAGYQMAFDPALGPDFAPSTMAAGSSMTLPINVTNIATDGSGNWGHCTGTGATPTDCWSLGYRWYNSAGALDSSNKTPIPASVTFGGQTGLINLAVSPPTAGVGQYTLRLDMVHTYNGTDLWCSDWAYQSTYYARAMLSSSPSNVHWAGSSPVERDEYPMSVVASGGTTQSVSLPDGSTAAIDLWTKNLTYGGSTGLGFADLGTSIGLDWYYSAADVNSIPGITGAAGWYTNYDERIEPGNGGAAYGYRDASDNVHPVNYSGDGALTSGTAARLERPRVTVFDENVLPGTWLGGTPTLTNAQAKTGANSWSIPASVSGGGEVIGIPAGPLAIPVPASAPMISLNQYPNISFSVRASADSGVGLGVKITDTTTGAPHWFIYTVGTDWTVPAGYLKLNKPASSPTGSWVSIYDNALNSITAAAGSNPTDKYVVNAIGLVGRGGSGTDYFDAISFQGASTSLSSNPVWNTGSGAYVGTESTDLPSGTSAPALQVSAADLSASPQCYSTCSVGGSNLSVALSSYPYATWGWKKIGGTTLAAAFHVFDARTNDGGNWITYYAGPTAPPGAINPIQVSPTVPTAWTTVTRNVLEDARQLFNYYNDNPGGAAANSLTGNLPATPDLVTLNGFSLDGGDSGSALFDPVSVQSLPNVSGAGSITGDDFLATYAGNQVHHFNGNGFLTSITDGNGNATKLVWSDNTTLPLSSWKWTGSPYSLASVQAPSNGATLADGTPGAVRALAVTSATNGCSLSTAAKCVHFTEQFGTAATPESGRSAEFDTNSSSDMVAIAPARVDSSCLTSGHSGCAEFAEFAYTGTHLLNVVYDPRGIGGITPDPTQATTIGYDTGNHPTSITDSGGTRLRVLPSSSSGPYVRASWQDAAGVLASLSTSDDLTPNGGVVRSWAPAGCGSCASAGTPVDLAAAYETDGLGAYTSQIKYRTGQGSLTTPCSLDFTNQTPAPGSCGNPEVSRTGTFAARAVDNYGDRIAGGETAWSQSPEQYAASYAASSPNLYRTSFSYDGFGRTLDTITPSQIDASTYVTQVKAAAGLDHYYRLDDTGSTAVDAMGSSGNGTISGATSGATGALVHDTDAALGFNGTSTSVQTNTESITGTFSVEAWVKPSAVSSAMTIAGSRGNTDYTFDIQIVPGVAQQMRLHADIGDSTKWLTQTADASMKFAANQWYQVVYVVTPDGWATYVDGRQLNSGRYDFNSGNPVLGDGTTAGALLIGKTGASSTPAYFAGSIDEFAVYTVALDARTVAAHYAAAGATAMDDAQTVYDNSGNAIQSFDNFIGNAGFEQGLTGWTASGATLTTPGASSSQTAANLGAGGSVSQAVQMVPGQKVRLQFALIEAGNANAQVSVATDSGGGTYTALAGMPLADPSASSSWHSVAWDVGLPMSTTGLVKLTISNAGSGTVSLDDVAIFTTYSSATYLAHGLPATQTAISGATGSAATMTSTYSYGVPDSTAAGSNLLTNGGFSSGTTGWALYPGTTTSAFGARFNDTSTPGSSWTLRDGDTTGFALTGGNYGSTASIHVTDGTGLTYIAQTVTTQITPGDTYSLSGLVANHRLTCARLRLYFRNSSGTTLGLVEAPCTSLTGGADRAGWAYQTLSSTAPTDAVSVVVQVQGQLPFVGTGSTDGYLWADELRLVHGPTPEPYLPDLAVTPAIFATSITANSVSGGTGADQNVTTSTSVDRWGRTLVSVDADGVGSMTQYAPNQTEVTTKSDGAGDATQTTGWDALGNPTQTSDPLGWITKTSYAFSGQPLDVTAAYGTPDQTITETVYDEAGRLTSTTANKNGSTAPANVTTTNTYAYSNANPVGNRVTTVADSGTGNANATTFSTYDLADNTLTRTVYTGSGTGGQARTTTSHFDTAGNATGTQAPIVPGAAPAPLCPDSTAQRCNSVSVVDINGRTIDSTDAYGIRTHTSYDLAGQPVRTIANYVPGGDYTSTQNIVTDTTYDAAARPLAITTYVVQTTLGYPALSSATPHVTSTSYDALGRSVSVVQPDGSWIHTVYTPAGRVDQVGQPGSASQADADVAWTRNLYDAAGRQTATLTNYDPTANAGYQLTNFESGTVEGFSGYSNWFNNAPASFGATIGSASSGSANTGFGSLTFTTSPSLQNGGVSLPLTGTFVAGHTYKAVVDAAGDTTGQSWLFVFGNPSADHGQVVLTNSTTAWTQLSATWTPAATYTGTVRLGFWGNYAQSQANTVHLDDVEVWDTATPTTNTPSVTVYDADSHPVASILPGGFAGDPPMVTRTAYDALGHATDVTVDAVAGAGFGEADVNLGTHTAYDGLGRKTDLTDPAGRVTHATYDHLGNTLSSTADYGDASHLNVTALAGYDNLGEVLATCSANAAAAGCTLTNITSSSLAWRYFYDAMGHEIRSVPPVNTTVAALDETVAVYDSGGRPTSTVSCPVSADTSCNASTNADRHTDMGYDAVGRATSAVTYAGTGPASPQLTTAITYDSLSHKLSVRFVGAAQSNADTIEYTYDTLGRVTAMYEGPAAPAPGDANAQTQAATYNPDGTTATRTDYAISSTASVFTYDTLGRLTNATSPTFGSGVSVGFSWRLDGLMATRSWSTGPATLVYGYDGAKRPTSECNGTAGACHLAPIDIERTYDQVGNVLTETQILASGADPTQNGTESFLYDAVNRVTKGTLGSHAKEYTYDADGNRLIVKINDVTTDTFAFDTTDQTKSDNSTNFSYDRYGNLTASFTSSVGSAAYAYDLADRLSSITQPDGSTVGFTFDAAGRHATRTSGTGANTTTLDTYSYLGSSDTVSVDVSTAGTGNTLNAGIDSMGDRLATAAATGFAWIVPDLHGNVVAQCSSAGLVTDVFRYDAYGNLIGNSLSAGSVPTPWRFQGRILESTAGSDTYDFSARAYVPDLGTFTSLDSVAGSAQNPITLNRYVYADANPATLVDPDGHVGINCGPDGVKCGYEERIEAEGKTPKYHGEDVHPGSPSKDSTPPSVTTPLDLNVIGPDNVPANVSDITINNLQGKAFEAQFYQNLMKEFPPDEYTIVTQRTLKTNGRSILVNGNARGKIWDFLVVNNKTGRVVLAVETKSGHAEEYRFSARTADQVIDQLDTIGSQGDEATYRLAYQNAETEAVSLYGEDWVRSELGGEMKTTPADPALQSKLDGLSTPEGKAGSAEGARTAGGGLEALSGFASILVVLDMALEISNADKARDRRQKLINDLEEIGTYDPDYAAGWWCKMYNCA